MTDTPEIYFHVSPYLNLYYSLEVATGTIREVYDEEYAEKMSKVFPERTLKRFKLLHDEQRFSWKIKSCLFDKISKNKLKGSMLLLADQLNDLLNEAYSDYQIYWKKVGPDLIRAGEWLEENKKELKKLLAIGSDLLQMSWRISELHIQIVDPFTGEPTGENTMSLGLGPAVSMPSIYLVPGSYFLILHEAQHILVGDSVRRVAEKYVTEEHAEYIDEAFMNMISSSILKRDEKFRDKFLKAMEVAKKLNFPPTSYLEKPKTPEGEIHKAFHEKRNRYIKYYRKLLQDDWEELLEKGEIFSKITENLLKRKLKKTKRIEQSELEPRIHP